MRSGINSLNIPVLFALEAIYFTEVFTYTEANKISPYIGYYRCPYVTISI